MKKILSRSIFLTIILLAINVAMVYGVTKNGIYTYKILSDGTISLIEYSGNAQNVIIPSTIDGKRVKKLDTNAFKNNVSVRTISLPEGLEIIDSYAFSACPNLTSISMPNTAVVYTNYTTSLNVTYNPSSTTDDKNVVWTSENDNIAKVDSNGIITGINEGTTTITAKVGTKIATCVVTVKKAVEENIYFSKTDETVLITESTKLLDLIFEPGINTSDDTIIWESSNSNIVEVDNNGVLKILSTGKVTITAFTKTGNAAHCEVNVIDYLKGDMDRNGVITANDAAMILDLYKNGNSSSEDIQIGDMDGNGTLTANDAAMILDMYKNGK